MEENVLRIVLVLVGLVFAGVGGFLIWRGKNLEKVCTVQVGGIVSDNFLSVKYKKGRRRESYYPIFKYSVGGIEYTQQSSFGTGRSPKFAIGQSVKVFYNPSNPKQYYVLEEGKLTIMAICFIAIGVIILVATPFMKF